MHAFAIIHRSALLAVKLDKCRDKARFHDALLSG
jgi:hypothetical protein